MDIERLKEHDLYVLRGVVGRLEEEQSIDPAIARQFEQVIDEAIARQATDGDYWKELRGDFMDHLLHCDTVTVSLKGIGETSYDTESIHNMMMALDDRVVTKSATSEEVAEAIEWATEELNDSIRYQHNYKAGCLNTIITALQAYQPTTRKDRTVEEVAISKTETTSCENRKTKTEKQYDDFRSYNAQGDCYKYVCSCNNCGQVLWEVADYNYGQGEKGHTPNYCPNCGRKLKENE